MITIVQTDGTLYAFRTGQLPAIGWANATHVCVYEGEGDDDDEIKHRREHDGDARAALVAEVARFWPGEVTT
jgi:hypothetical protein